VIRNVLVDETIPRWRSALLLPFAVAVVVGVVVGGGAMVLALMGDSTDAVIDYEEAPQAIDPVANDIEVTACDVGASGQGIARGTVRNLSNVTSDYSIHVVFSDGSEAVADVREIAPRAARTWSVASGIRGSDADTELTCEVEAERRASE
jgi:hypothetical protein